MKERIFVADRRQRPVLPEGALVMLNVAHAAPTWDVNGPGRRFTVWVQGCRRGCPGCFNPDLQPPVPRRRVEPAALASEARTLEPLAGISVTGGEPFEQASAVAEFVERLRADAPVPGFTAVAFTGYTVEELHAGPAEWTRLLGVLDLLVDGPYRRDRACDLPLRGSSNQRLLALSPAGEALREQVSASPPGRFGVEVTAEGGVVVTGFPPPNVLAGLWGGLGSEAGE